jgi:DNA-binding transcriptional MerR regulator
MSADSIRHYEKLGLLKAAPRTPSGYRDYPPESLARVRLIRRALGVGFSLEELAAILQVRDRGGIPCHTVFASVKLKVKQIEQQIKELKAMRRLLLRILKNWGARLARMPRGETARLLETLPEEMEERANANRRDVRGSLRHRRTRVRPKPRHRKSVR